MDNHLYLDFLSERWVEKRTEIPVLRYFIDLYLSLLNSVFVIQHTSGSYYTDKRLNVGKNYHFIEKGN